VKRFLLLTISIFALAPAAAQASDCTSSVSGDWSAPTSWANCASGVPGSGDTATIDNDDLIHSDNDVTVASVTLNSGTLQVQSHTLTATSFITVDDSKIFLSTGSTINGSVTLTNEGRLGGYGTVTGDVANTSGLVKPGDNGPSSPTGTITIGGSYVQESAGVLGVSVRSSGADRLNVQPGMAAIDGTLEISKYSGAVTAGQTYPIITTTAGLTGTFGTVTGLGDLTTNYTANGLSLVGPPVPFVPPVVVPAKPTITLPSNKKCKKTVTVKIKPPAGTTIKTATVKAGKKKVKTKKSNGVVTAKVKLKKKTKISVTATTTAGGTLKASKTYKRCG
jgi:hypothetical protein